MQILVASSSPYRQAMYREAIERLGHRVAAAGNGVECVEQLRGGAPDLLVLEAPLLWGGSDGVLEVVEQDWGPHSLPVIVLAVGSGSIDWFQLSKFHIDDFMFRVPTMQELGRAIASVATAGLHPDGRPLLKRDPPSEERLAGTWKAGSAQAAFDCAKR